MEILKALYRGAEILILDEPTAVLTPQEVDDLIEVMRNLRAKGTSIIFITHKIREVLAISDRVTVLRRGKKVGTKPTSETNTQDLAEMMVGREVLLEVKKDKAEPGEEVLQIRNLVVKDRRGALKVNGASLAVRRGEILGIAGVEGNGQTELVEAIAGLIPESGRFCSTTATLPSGRRPHQAGWADTFRKTATDAFDPRLYRGRKPDLRLHTERSTRGGRPVGFTTKDNAAKLSKLRYPTAVSSTYSKLSGGNQQKVVVLGV